MNILFKGCTSIEDIPTKSFYILNISINILPLVMAICYQNITAILGIFGSVSGFLMIYVIPVVTYMKMQKLEIEHPLLAAAIQENEVTFYSPYEEDQNSRGPFIHST